MSHKSFLLGIEYLEGLLCRNVGCTPECPEQSLNKKLSLIHLAFTDDPLGPYVLEHFFFGLHPVILALVAHFKVFKVVKELIKRNVSVPIRIEDYADLEQVVNFLSFVKLCQFEDEILDFDTSALLVHDISEDGEYGLPSVCDNVLEHILQESDRFSDSLGDLIILVPELDLLQN